MTLLAVGGDDGIAPADIDGRLARYRAALARPPADHAVPRDDLRIRRAPVATSIDNSRAVPGWLGGTCPGLA